MKDVAANALAVCLYAAAAILASTAPAAAQQVGAMSAVVNFVLVGAAVALALAGALWAIAENQASRDVRQTLKQTNAHARTNIVLRDELLSGMREAVVVWGAEFAEPLSFGGGGQLLDSCLSGPDAAPLEKALEALAEDGQPFALAAHTPDGRQITVRGKPTGGHAAVFLSEGHAGAATTEIDYRGALDAVPVPMWIRDKTLQLRFVNRAFLKLSGSLSADSALDANVALDRWEHDLASSAQNSSEPVEAKRYAVLDGQRRALSFTLTPISGGAVAGTALDLTRTAEAEARIQQHVEANAEILDQLATAVAIFGPDRKLTFYNRAYVRLWQLPEAWLNSHPTEGDIVDRLRETRRLPEQADFRAWKREHLKLFERAGDHPEEQWHLPGGQTLRVIAQAHPLGGLLFLYEDVSSQLRLESNYNALIKTQRATLDTLREGVAVFGPDGRLRLFNAAFARIWGFKPDELSGEPHLRRLAETCAARYGTDGMWDIVINSVTSAGPERRREYGEINRSDSAILSLTIAPLPDGASLASFADVTDRSRIENALRERNQALERADNLKTEFVGRVSHELRTPLNSILGFAELLDGELAGSLSTRHNEYVSAIVSASHILRDLINDILDLSHIDAGIMALDLEEIDLYGLLFAVTDQVRAGASTLGLSITLECKEDAGRFVADRRRIGQVLFNLLSNALKFTPREGIVEVGGKIVGDEVQLWVADTGPGLSRDAMPAAFERFVAKSGSGKAGAGLGLALVNRFVELHNGWVELESVTDKGTKVTCHLPRIALQQADSDSDSRDARAG